MLVLSPTWQSTPWKTPQETPQTQRTVGTLPATAQVSLVPWKWPQCISALAFLMIPLKSRNHFLLLIHRTHEGFFYFFANYTG